MLSLLVLLSFGAAPNELAPFDAPMPSLGKVLEPEKGGGYPSNERVVPAPLPQCELRHVVKVSHLVRQLSSLAQPWSEWLDKTPGEEAALFGKRGEWSGRLEAVGRAPVGTQGACAALPERPASAPKRLCKLSTARAQGEHWVVAKGRPLAVVQVKPPRASAAQPCTPRLLATLFAPSGEAFLHFEVDEAGLALARLVGKGRCIDIAADVGAAAHVAKRTLCKP